MVDKGYRRQSNKEYDALGSPSSSMRLLTVSYRYLQSLEEEVQALRNQSSSASPAYACSNDDRQVEPEPTGTSQLLQSDLGALERQPVDFGHSMCQCPDFLPPRSLGKRTLAGQTLGEVHIPSELALSLVQEYYRLNPSSVCTVVAD